MLQNPVLRTARSRDASLHPQSEVDFDINTKRGQYLCNSLL